MTRYEPDEPDQVDVEELVDTTDREQLPPRYKPGEKIPHIPLEQLLAFENTNPGNTGRKEGIIGRELGLRAVNYYQQLNAAIDNPQAIALDPILCRRLQDDRRRRVAARNLRTITR